MNKPIRVAIIHYWFVGRGGGERVVESLAELYPQADLFSLVADRATLAPELSERRLQTSFLDAIPFARKFHRHFIFLHPLALEQFDLSNYDLVISSESGPAKGVITSSKTCHICYCYSPMRYIWDMYPQYRRGMGFFVGTVFSVVSHYLRLWDHASAQRVDHFVANSRFIASRIRKYYGRESTVIHPPVEVSRGAISDRIDDYYLAVSRLVDYKRIDLAVRCCTELGRPLRVIGDGPEYQSLKRIAGPTVTFLGHLPDAELRDQMMHCRALLFPGEEDFGIVPLEVQSCGRPVIAYGAGGALETVRGAGIGESIPSGATGIFFFEQSADGLMEAVRWFEANEKSFSPSLIHEHSKQFDKIHFQEQFRQFAESALAEFAKPRSV